MSSRGGMAPDYLEFAWVCAPNAAGQSITADTITTLTIDTEVVDLGGYGSIGSNQITLAPGTYYFKGNAPVRSLNVNYQAGVLSLYNTSLSSYVSRGGAGGISTALGSAAILEMEGQFTIAAQNVFELRMWVHSLITLSIDHGIYNNSLPTLATAGADQRTTLKLWKLA